MKPIRYTVAAVLFAAAFAVPALSQPIPFDSDRWEITAQEHSVETYQGKPSLTLKGGAAILQDVDFTDGIIEFEIAFPKDRTFTGVMWRLQDGQNFEDFYFRPHQSGNPDANQYTPVFNGISGWQLYYGEAYSAPVVYPFEAWIPVKIVVSGQQAEIYIQDMNKPALFISELKRPTAAGKVGVKASSLAATRFASFRVTPMPGPALQGTATAAEPAPAGTVMAWSVSNVFPENKLEAAYHLSDADKAGLTWTTLPAEASGIANLARIQGIDDTQNTAFARLTITSDRDQVKKLTFGFSDRVRVYFNGQLLYGGSDIYESRDYRYLGTVGYFDDLYLPLQAGANEVWFAVSEGFGGWGIQARFEDPSGLTLQP